MRLVAIVALCAAITAVTPAARAQNGDKAPADKAGAADTPHQAGEYGGVSAGAEAGAAVHVGKRGKHPRVLWIGFRPGEAAGAQVFVQLDREVEYRQSVEAGRLVIDLDRAVPVRRNTLRPLDTHFFDTPVARVAIQRSRKKGHHLQLVVTFKDPAQAREAALSGQVGKDGLFYLTAAIAP